MNDVRLQVLRKSDEMWHSYPLIRQLSPALSESMYRAYLSEMVPHRYYQVVAVLNNRMIAVSGYWIATKLYCGKYLEVDNFVVDQTYRSQKIGALLLSKLEEIALTEQCDVMMLDAYLQNTRAHNFYERHGFKAKGFHFIKKMKHGQSGNECMR